MTDQPKEKIGSDCDYDPILDEVWKDIQENGLQGISPTEEDWKRWDKEDQEMLKKSNPDNNNNY